jgi:hypothetical protein
VRIGDIDATVRHEGLFRSGRLRGPDVESAIDLP